MAIALAILARLALGDSNLRATGFLAYNEYVFAVKDAKGWHGSSRRSKLPVNSVNASVLGIDRVASSAAVQIDSFSEPTDAWALSLPIKCKAMDGATEPPPIGVFVWGVKPSFPRKVRRVFDTTGVYRRAALDAFHAKGTAVTEVSELEIYRVDLGCDGRDEVLVSAHGSRPHDVNSYGIVFARNLVGTKVQTQYLFFDKFASAHVLSVVDLSGRGKLNVVLGGAIQDGVTMSLWAFDGKKLRQQASYEYGL